MKIVIDIETDNAALHDEHECPEVNSIIHRAEICRILQVVASRIITNKETSGGCRDSNGNTVGKWEVTE